MKRKVIAIVGTLMLVAALVPMTVGATPETVTRDLPDSVAVGANFDVTMTLGASFGQVVETLPAGFTYVSCAAGTNMPAGGVSGTAVGQVVTFTFYATATPATFTYTVTAPATAVTGAAFSGVFKSGPAAEEAVGGDTTMDVVSLVATVTRDLPDSVAVNAEFDVTMTLGASFGQVVETLPAGFTYVSCAAGTNIPAGGVSGTAVGQVVTFTFYASATPATFTYTVTAPSTAVTGAAFSGIFKSGPAAEEAVGGDTTMDVVSLVATVTRDLPDSVNVNAEFDVTMTLGASFGQVVETLPTGFTYVCCAAGTNIPAGGVSGTAVGQVVTFTFYASATPATFTYTVTAPATAVTGATFSGVFKSGPAAEEAVGGDTTMDVVTVGVYYTLTIAVSPVGSGTTSPAVGTHSYAAGTVVAITATAAAGYEFDHWGGHATGTIPSTTVTMNSNKSVTAYFEAIPPPPVYPTFADWIYDKFIG